LTNISTPKLQATASFEKLVPADTTIQRWHSALNPHPANKEMVAAVSISGCSASAIARFSRRLVQNVEARDRWASHSIGQAGTHGKRCRTTQRIAAGIEQVNFLFSVYFKNRL